MRCAELALAPTLAPTVPNILIGPTGSGSRTQPGVILQRVLTDGNKAINETHVLLVPECSSPRRAGEADLAAR